MKAFILLFSLLMSYNAIAQSLSLFDIDKSSFPTMRAKFFAFDAQGNLARPSVGQLSITEDGVTRIITDVSCPLPAPPKALSSVLVIDVSGSMSFGNNTIRNIDIAKIAARAWVNALPLGTSECAVTSFDNVNYLNQDFTTDRSALLRAIDSLKPLGGTNYDAALINPTAGGLVVGNRGKHQKVIVLLTDGQSATSRRQEIIAEANRQNCVIYCVTLGMSAPAVLQEIALNTGGQIFENITTAQEAEQAYNTILQLSLGVLPCTIQWQSAIACQEKSVAVELVWQAEKSLGNYKPIQALIPSLEVQPRFIAYGERLPTTTNDTTISITSRNAGVRITGIRRQSGSAEFRIVNTTFPINISQNQSVNITLRFAPTDSGLKYASFEIITDKCPAYFSANGGFLGKRSKEQTLKVKKPNGGEIFVIGSDTLLIWEGIAPTDTVKIEYSTDNGKNWKNITNSATGLEYIWRNIPKPTSTECLVRVLQLQNSVSNSTDSVGELKSTLQGHINQVRSVAYSPNGNIVASRGVEGAIKLWDVATGLEIRTLQTPFFGWNSNIVFSPDGSTIAAVGLDRTINFWDVLSGEKIDTINMENEFCRAIAFSPDGRVLATSSYSGPQSNSIIQLWDIVTGQQIQVLRGHDEPTFGLSYSPDGKTLVSSDVESIRFWDVSTGRQTLLIQRPTDGFETLVYSPDGKTVASGGRGNIIQLWNVTTGQEVLRLQGHTGRVYGLAYSPDGRILASGSADKTIKLWNVSTGLEQLTLQGHADEVFSVAFSPDASLLLSGSFDATAKLWRVALPILQQDQSDTVFTIVAPEATSRNIDMGEVLLGSDKDSVIVDFMRNIGTYSYDVDSIYVRGADSAAFSLVSGIPVYTVAASGTYFGEFRFSPTRVGVHTAEIVIITQSDTLVQTITGIGVQRNIALASEYIDFGAVNVGTSRDSIRVATIQNTGSQPITITQTKHNLPNIVDFSTLVGGGSFTLQPGETHPMDLRFSPSAVGRTSGVLEFYYDGVGSPAIVPLVGEGIFQGVASAEVHIPDVEGYPGDEVEIPIVLKSSENLLFAGVGSITADLIFNPTLLLPIGYEMQRIDDRNALITVANMPVSVPLGEALATIRCKVGLGNAEFSALTLSNISTNGGTANIRSTGGRFTLLGICYEGGARLIEPNSGVVLLRMYPNPGFDIIDIEVQLIERGGGVLTVFDTGGKEVFRTQIEFEPGKVSFKLDTRHLSNGIYYVVLQTPTMKLTEQLRVNK